MHPAWRELLLLVSEMLVYFGGMLLLFRLRGRFGIGAFFAALCSLHFLETYLAASVYVEVLDGWRLTPGSVVLFSGKLILLLLVYIREDAAIARQPVYGLLFGNLIICAVTALLRLHTTADLALLSDMGWLMLWGTALLFADSLLMILLYERLSRNFRGQLFLRLWLTTALVLSFDQAGFFAVLHYALDVPWSAGLAGWVGKIVAAGVYSGLTTAYLRVFERRGAGAAPRRRLADLFEILTYRQRYEALQQLAAHDALTGLLQRGQFDAVGQRLLAAAQRGGEPLGLLMLDADHFKSINDRYGHPVGDQVLRSIAGEIRRTLRGSDYAFRYGGEEFAVLAPATSREGVLALAEKLRRHIEACVPPGIAGPVTVSIGVATTRDGRESLDALVGRADRLLYAAKQAGRNRVCADAGARPPEAPPSLPRPAQAAEAQS